MVNWRSAPLLQALEGAPSMAYVKGEATGNDFVVMYDPLDEHPPSDQLVRAICDRRFGVGGDGLLRIVSASVVPGDRAWPDGSRGTGSAAYFMDYRNADASVAEMCGNGARVFARVLTWMGLQVEKEFQIVTRGGLRAISSLPDGCVRVGMGEPRYSSEPRLTVDADVEGPGRAVWMPNPHAVFRVGSLGTIGDLARPPAIGPVGTFPDGVNVEFVEVAADRALLMRVHERGVGETLSCGTGACAVAVSQALDDGVGPDGVPWQVNVPGGRLEVAWDASGVSLTGPVQLCAGGVLSREWVGGHE